MDVFPTYDPGSTRRVEESFETTRVIDVVIDAWEHSLLGSIRYTSRDASASQDLTVSGLPLEPSR